jgi:two-component system, cell cycle response regulator
MAGRMRIGARQEGSLSAASESIAVLQEVLSAHNRGLVHDYLRVAQLARETAVRLGVEPATATRVELAARLHDIGHLTIPEAILNKPGPLSAKEWALVRTHPEAGARMIGAAPALADVAELVRSHHERYDGSGYPDGLRGDQIPLGACVIAVCAAFVAMMRQRPYIDGITVAEALAELQRGAGTQFHPAVVTAFLEVFDQQFARV